MKTVQEKDRIRLHPEGELTVSKAAEFKDSLVSAMQKSDRLELELDDVTAVDLSCLQILCAAHRTAVRDDKVFTISPPGEPALLNIGARSGFAVNKICCFHTTGDCLWGGGGGQ